MQPEPAIAFLDSIGGGEVLTIFVVILLLFGPKRLPEMARMLGKTSAKFQRAFQDFKDELMREDEPEPPPPEKKPDVPMPEEYADQPDAGTEHPDHSEHPEKPGQDKPPLAG